MEKSEVAKNYIKPIHFLVNPKLHKFFDKLRLLGYFSLKGFFVHPRKEWMMFRSDFVLTLSARNAGFPTVFSYLFVQLCMHVTLLIML